MLAEFHGQKERVIPRDHPFDPSFSPLSKQPCSQEQSQAAASQPAAANNHAAKQGSQAAKQGSQAARQQTASQPASKRASEQAATNHPAAPPSHLRRCQKHPERWPYPPGDRHRVVVHRLQNQARSLSWDKLAPPQCKGSAVVARTTKGSGQYPPQEALHREEWPALLVRHLRSVRRIRPGLLTQACRGKHEGRWVAGGMRGQLKVLR